MEEKKNEDFTSKSTFRFINMIASKFANFTVPIIIINNVRKRRET